MHSIDQAVRSRLTVNTAIQERGNPVNVNSENANFERSADSMRTVPRPLSLQGIDLDWETPADVYRSGNSVYTCIARSGFSMGC